MKSMQRHHSYTTAAKDSPAPEALSAATAYWLTTVLEDRAESAPPPPAEERSDD